MKKIILGIDASRSAVEKPTGVERYSNEIIAAILNMKSGFEVKLYTPKAIKNFPLKIQKVMPFPRLWTLIRLSYEMLINKPDILFVPSHVIPFFSPKNTLTTVHDVAFKKYPEAYGKFKGFYLNLGTMRAIKKAKNIIVPSNGVKLDLLNFYNIDPEKIIVIHHGKLSLKKVDTKKDLNFNKFGIQKKDRFFLFVGRLEKKKNIDLLLSAFDLAQKNYPSVKLVLAGSPDKKLKAIFQKNVIVTNYVNEETLSHLMSSAAALILPSKDEGFGMPVLQAWEANIPVICSDIPVLREVADDAALFFNPTNEEDLARCMEEILNKKNVCDELVSNGKKRLKKFSWKKNAATLLSQMRK